MKEWLLVKLLEAASYFYIWGKKHTNSLVSYLWFEFCYKLEQLIELPLRLVIPFLFFARSCKIKSSLVLHFLYFLREVRSWTWEQCSRLNQRLRLLSRPSTIVGSSSTYWDSTPGRKGKASSTILENCVEVLHLPNLMLKVSFCYFLVNLFLFFAYISCFLFSFVFQYFPGPEKCEYDLKHSLF